MVGSSSVTPDEAEGIHNRTYSQVYASTSRNSHYSSIPNNSAEMDHYYAETSLKSQFLRQSIELKKELGNGNFGVVYSASLSSSFVKAVAPDIYPASSITESTVTVAVKVLKSTTNAKAQSDFEAEINIMRHFKHPNIVRMLATLVEEQPFMLVLEFLPYGDLKGVLVYSALRSITWYESEFLFVLAQLADALAYLAANRFVHRDIAARNCLVGKDLNVKISDFGLSRVLDEEKDYYKLQTKGQMPIKVRENEFLKKKKLND